MPDTSPAPGFRIGALVSIVRLAISSRLRARLRERGLTDLTPAQQVVLQLLTPDGMRLTDLAATAGIAKQSMAYLVGQLERTGYVERVADPADSRAKLISRTPKGWAYNSLAAEVVDELEAEWSALIGERDFDALKRQLGRIAAALGVRYSGSVAEASTLVAPRRPGSR